jgi:hypothetical protein
MPFFTTFRLSSACGLRRGKNKSGHFGPEGTRRVARPLDQHGWQTVVAARRYCFSELVDIDGDLRRNLRQVLSFWNNSVMLGVSLVAWRILQFHNG